MSKKTFDILELEPREIFHLMISGITPRPIAFVGSYDSKARDNLAPFSFFNGFGSNPPIIGFSPALSGRTGKPKDTLLNIRETKEFTVSIVNHEMVEQVSLSSCEYPSDVDEFTKSGFTKLKGEKVNASYMAESPFVMECKLYNIIELGNKPGSGNLVLGEIVQFHVDSEIYTNDRIDPAKLDPVSRLGYAWYSRANKGLFEVNKPKWNGIGFEQLPEPILLSDKFTGNQLAKLAGVKSIPSKALDQDLQTYSLDELYTHSYQALGNDQIDNAWQYVLAIIEKNA